MMIQLGELVLSDTIDDRDRGPYTIIESTAVDGGVADVYGESPEASAECARAIVNGMNELTTLRAENARLKSALVALTPGGSEFHNSPDNCIQWIRERLEHRAKIAGERNQLRAENARLVAAMATALGEPVWSKMQELGLATMYLDWETGRVVAFNTDGDMVADKETIQEVFDLLHDN